MSGSNSDLQSSFSQEQLEKLDQFRTEYELQLRASASPKIEQFIEKCEPDLREELLKDLIAIELELCEPGQRKELAANLKNRLPGKERLIEGLLVDLESTANIKSSLPERNHKAHVGNYKLLQQIGEGGMGSVWMAEQEKPVKRRVAIKLIRSDIGSNEAIARFEAERQALAMMDHQNIAKVLDAGTTDDGSPYFVMELVKGIPITQYCDENKLSIDERLGLLIPVCNAVQHAHQKGIIHRDLKPSNVLVTLYDGKPVPKVIDFGLAKALEHTTKLTDKTMFTEFGKIVGTVQYMSPEQAEMNALDVDTRTDVYSLGVMLYELLTGSTPLDKETLGKNAILQILAIIREMEPPRPSHRLSSSGDLVTGISEQRKIIPSKLHQILEGELDWIVMKALEKDRTRRYETALGLAMDIKRYLGDEPIVARPPSTGYRLSKFLKKNRTFVTTSATILFLLIVGIVGTSLGFYRAYEFALSEKRQRELADNKTDEATQARNEAIEAKQIAYDEAKRARDSEASGKFQLANARWEANRVAEARELLHQIPVEYRNYFEWHFSNRHFLGSDFTCYGHTKAVHSVAFSPDGTRIASGSSDQTIKIWDAKTGAEITTLKGHSSEVTSVCFSPDGTRIASGSWDQTIKIWDAKTGAEISTLKGHLRGVTSVCFSPDGTRIASGSYDQTIKVWDATTGSEIITLMGHTDYVNCVCFSPDGTRIASGCDDKTIKIWDTKTGSEISTLKGHSLDVTSVCFSPDGTRMASGSYDQTIKVWDAETGAEITTLKGHADYVNSVCFSPDGTRIASGSDDQTIKIWDAKTGGEIITLKGHTDHVYSVAFSPDGTRIASGSWNQTIKIWDAKTGAEIITLKGHSLDVNSVCFSPDGTRIASGSDDQTIKIWDAKTGAEITTLIGHSDFVNSVAFSPDSTRIASGSRDQTIKIWDAITGSEITTLKGHTGWVSCVCFSPDGRRIASGSDDQTIKVWDAKTGAEISMLKGSTDYVNCVCFSPDGTRIVSASDDPTIQVWDAKTGSEIITLKGHSLDVASVCFSPDGTRIASASWDQTIKIWDAKTGAEINTLKGHSDEVSSVCFSPDGTRIASGSWDQTIKIWDAKTGSEITTLNGSTDYVNSVCFSPDGTRIASGSDDKTINIWNAKTGSELTPLGRHAEYVTSVCFSPDGSRIASGSWDENVKIWDAKTGAEIITLRGHGTPVSSVCFSPDGTRIASGDWDKNIKIWDAKTGSEITMLKGHSDKVSSVCFGPKGKRLYSKCYERKFVWDVETGQLLENVDWIEVNNKNNVSPNGRWMVVPSGPELLLVDLKYKDTPDEKAYREFKARLDPIWHTEQAARSDEEINWYACLFHRAWVMKAKPDDPTSYDNLHAAHDKLAEQYKTQNKPLDPYLAPIVKEMLKLPRFGSQRN